MSSSSTLCVCESHSVHILFDGYCICDTKGEVMKANCTCTLIRGPQNIIVDTMTAWDRERILGALLHHELCPEDINWVISTHGHSDHIGNNNLFLNAKHIVGFSISHEDTYFVHPFEQGTPYNIHENVTIIPTPGHTLSDISVIVKTDDNVTYAIAGDLFENGNDIENPEIWQNAGSEDQNLQKKNRYKVAQISDWIIPGHGPMFKCTEEKRKILQYQAQDPPNPQCE